MKKYKIIAHVINTIVSTVFLLLVMRMLYEVYVIVSTSESIDFYKSDSEILVLVLFSIWCMFIMGLNFWKYLYYDFWNNSIPFDPKRLTNGEYIVSPSTKRFRVAFYTLGITVGSQFVIITNKRFVFAQSNFAHLSYSNMLSTWFKNTPGEFENGDSIAKNLKFDENGQFIEFQTDGIRFTITHKIEAPDINIIVQNFQGR